MVDLCSPRCQLRWLSWKSRTCPQSYRSTSTVTTGKTNRRRTQLDSPPQLRQNQWGRTVEGRQTLWWRHQVLHLPHLVNQRTPTLDLNHRYQYECLLILVSCLNSEWWVRWFACIGYTASSLLTSLLDCSNLWERRRLQGQILMGFRQRMRRRENSSCSPSPAASMSSSTAWRAIRWGAEVLSMTQLYRLCSPLYKTCILSFSTTYRLRRTNDVCRSIFHHITTDSFLYS